MRCIRSLITLKVSQISSELPPRECKCTSFLSISLGFLEVAKKPIDTSKKPRHSLLLLQSNTCHCEWVAREKHTSFLKDRRDVICSMAVLVTV